MSDEGTRKILPKDKGLGVMINTFQSREFGFGKPMTPEELEGVNKTREGKKYIDSEAAMLKRGSDKKQPLTKSPLLVEFEYGARKRILDI